MQDPWQHIPALLERVHPDYIRKTYGVEEWEDAEDFLARLAAKTGKLLKVCVHSLHMMVCTWTPESTVISGFLIPIALCTHSRDYVLEGWSLVWYRALEFT